jgi:hypothetical protein
MDAARIKAVGDLLQRHGTRCADGLDNGRSFLRELLIWPLLVPYMAAEYPIHCWLLPDRVR